jgi:hypothetical protein
MHPCHRYVAVAALAALAAVAHAEPSAALDPDVAERAAAALAPFKSGLMQALQAGLSQSPATAIGVCRTEAPQIAAAAAGPGVGLGRSSHRLRNPANAPAPWMREIIDGYLADPADRAPRTVRLGDGRYGYAEPIVMQPLCTVCHGSTIDPELGRSIAALYPDDRATGFEVGDLRGIFWVTLDTATPAPPAR